ncbi:6543_t:CDS:2 [Funneliformis geosporum]|uniref:Sensitive to high expression protein 9, mitochondrial n=1 Tax=Funneliformis geosporum TaxID=1117311 RepID=A0A9W4SBF2_9GLOM|nr:6543_t:CDS:2 [Funneliformis geosporum]CAI2163658.1 19016_t:CDS:2 [Funneliformis geosporum]
MISTPRYLIKPLHFCKADISLISVKFYPILAQRRFHIFNKQGLNNLILKTRYNCCSFFSNKNTTPQQTKDKNTSTINTLKERPSTTSSLLSTFQHSATISLAKKQSLIERINKFINTIKIKDRQHMLNAASQVLNEFTGYSAVEKLKEKVIQQEQEFVTTRQRLASSKLAYEEAVTKRSETQREINDLLQRKHQWSNDDVVRFTELYRNEHLNEQAESFAKEEFRKWEKQVEKEYSDLTRSIMMRYHEEQVWSDKIRSASTYGTIALMTINVILFICVQSIFEPHKRQKLADKFEELLIKKSDEDEKKFEIGIFRPLYQRFEKLDEMINFEKQNVSEVGIETKESDMIPLPPESTSQETEPPRNEILITRGELDKIVILSTLIGAGAGWLLSFIFSERFNRR